jgi:propanol-preferring alcohol dehydrogenase
MTVAIIGVGGLGSFALQVAKLLGAAPVVAVDTAAPARERATVLGADIVIDPAAVESVGREIKLATEGGVDVAAEFVGEAATVDMAVKSLRRGGVAVATGIGPQPLLTLPPTLWATSEYELRGSFGSLPGDTERILGWLAAGSVVPPALRPVPIDDAAAAIGAALAGPRSGDRLVVVPN